MNLQIRQIDDETGGEQFGPERAQELDGGFRGAPRGNQIVDQNDALPRRDGIRVHFHLIESVLEGIRHPHRGVGQLAFLADRHEACGQLIRHRAPQYEPARLDAGNVLDARAGPGPYELIYGAAERPRVAQERGDVGNRTPGRG